MPNHPAASGRQNQRYRTRKDLLIAAARLLKAGRPPDMEAVAKEAMVSRATAYRHFPSLEALLVEAPLEGATPDAAQLFAGDDSTDPALRIDKAEAALHEMVYRNEAQLRVMLAASLAQATTGRARDGFPLRQNRRSGLIEAALAPARPRFTATAYAKLAAALALIFGVEAMIVFRDVLALDEQTARQVKSWAARVLVRAALEESAARRRP
jgi:AcrR family transcriptional regulator